MEENRKSAYKNPFPVTAVANFHNNEQNDMVVETNAIRKMKKIIDEWMSNKSDGITVAVQGEYGTGKTQLAVEMQRHIKRHGGEKYHFICLDSPAASFLEMYKNRFLIELTMEEVLGRLEECYREIIIEDMEEDEIYKRYIEKNRNVKSLELIKKFGLAKSRYDFVFENKLEKVTKNVKFVPAMLLLLDERFEKDAWDWFNGKEPSEAMRERGVRFSINDDTSALESIGVFAFLFGQQGHSFILFIDEMEKIISNTERIRKDSFEALKKLTETTKATKSMLILCGLPDHYTALPGDVQQRIAYQVKTENITLDEIKKYVSIANERVNNKKAFNPFSENNLRDILDISSGNIRSAIRLLYHAGNWYMENQSPIDGKALCEILTSAYGSFDLNGIRKGLAQIFTSKGWLYEEKKSIGNAQIDFWLPSVLTKKDSLDNGIEIYLAQNVMSEEEYVQISQRICDKSDNCQICIVEGFINEHYMKCLSEGNKHILRYRMPEFGELLISLIEGEKARCDANIKQNDFSALNKKIEQLSRIVRGSINDLNENSIGKQEFYYFMRKFMNVKQEEFYAIPDKDSDFYLLISEIQKVIDGYDIGRNSSNEIGILYLFREFSYILYYVSEKPQELQISLGNVDVLEVCRNAESLVSLFSREFGQRLRKATNKYRFVLEYLCQDDGMKETHFFRINEKENLLWDMVYGEDFFTVSRQMRQVSQNFCADILIKRPEVIEKYGGIFVSFYGFIYVTEPAVIRGEKAEIDLEVLREYYDLLRNYFRGYWMDDSGRFLSELFENYERGIRRMAYEREY